MKYLLYVICFVLMDVVLPREENGCSCRGSYPDPDPAVRPEVPAVSDEEAADATVVALPADEAATTEE